MMHFPKPDGQELTAEQRAFLAQMADGARCTYDVSTRMYVSEGGTTRVVELDQAYRERVILPLYRLWLVRSVTSRGVMVIQITDEGRSVAERVT